MSPWTAAPSCSSAVSSVNMAALTAVIGVFVGVVVERKNKNDWSKFEVVGVDCGEKEYFYGIFA